MTTQVDPWGRVVVDQASLPEILLNGNSLEDVFVADDDATARFNELCQKWDKAQFMLRPALPPDHSPEEEHAARASRWLVCDDLRGLDVREFLVGACATQEQRDRVNEEMDLFEARDLVPLLQTMICLVEHFRANKIVWGVGRGSSVASYVLYMIGVHRIDPMKYGLSINEFLK